jgi:hypothetical protein
MDRFWKVLMEHLLLVGEVPTQEYILELLDGLCVVQVNFLFSVDKIVDHFA